MAKKESLAAKSVKLQGEMKKFLQENSFKRDNLDLSLIYNPWHDAQGGLPFSYSLSTSKNGTSVRFTLQELTALKSFLNNITILE